MNKRQETIVANVDKQRELVFAAERWLWAHPQTGYTEWEANEYLIEKYEALGYKLVRADKDPNFGKIPGFYTDLDTGKPGPTFCLMAELDALDIANHPESVNGMAHSCGHHAQGAALLAIAAALKEPGALDGLCGKIRLMMVPAEEMIQLGFREELRKKGLINYMGGKVEFIYRGYLDGVDIAMMIHGTVSTEFNFTATKGSNGCIAKNITYKGKSSHAGGAPDKGINAQYAAMLGLQACNDLRETFKEADTVRFHPIMKGVNCAVNIIPDEMKIESFVRGGTVEAIKRENIKVNRALTGGALAMGAGLELADRPGYSPLNNDVNFLHLAEKVCCDLVGAEKVGFDYNKWGTGSTDFGDISLIMPGIHIYAAGASGTGHGIDYQITDTENITLGSAKVQLLCADALLSNDAAEAKRIIDAFDSPYASKEAYLAELDSLYLDKDTVKYDENGNATVDFKN